MSLNTPNSKGNIPSECPMILAIPRLAAPGATGPSAAVEEVFDSRHENGCTQEIYADFDNLFSLP